MAPFVRATLRLGARDTKRASGIVTDAHQVDGAGTRDWHAYEPATELARGLAMRVRAGSVLRHPRQV